MHGRRFKGITLFCWCNGTTPAVRNTGRVSAVQAGNGIARQTGHRYTPGSGGTGDGKGNPFPGVVLTRQVLGNGIIRFIIRFEYVAFFYRCNAAAPAIVHSGTISAAPAGNGITRQTGHFHALQSGYGTGNSQGDQCRTIILIIPIAVNLGVHHAGRFECVTCHDRRNGASEAVVDDGGIIAISIGKRIARQALHFYARHTCRAGNCIPHRCRNIVLINLSDGKSRVLQAGRLEGVPFFCRRYRPAEAVWNGGLVSGVAAADGITRQTGHYYALGACGAGNCEGNLCPSVALVRKVSGHGCVFFVSRREGVTFLHWRNRTGPAVVDDGAVSAVAAGNGITRQAGHFYIGHFRCTRNSKGYRRCRVVLIALIARDFAVGFVSRLEGVARFCRRNCAVPAIVNCGTVIAVLIGNNRLARQTFHCHATDAY